MPSRPSNNYIEAQINAIIIEVQIQLSKNDKFWFVIHFVLWLIKLYYMNILVWFSHKTHIQHVFSNTLEWRGELILE